MLRPGFGKALSRADFEEVLRSLTTLEKISDKPAAVFWKEVDGK
jgi:hypothetical protein